MSWAMGGILTFGVFALDRRNLDLRGREPDLLPALPDELRVPERLIGVARGLSRRRADGGTPPTWADLA
jgi:hypothetical protein